MLYQDIYRIIGIDDKMTTVHECPGRSTNVMERCHSHDQKDVEYYTIPSYNVSEKMKN